MDDSDNTPSQEGGQQDRTADQSTSSRSKLSETTLRAGERTCTQKLFQPRETRQFQRNLMVAKVCTVHQNDKGHRFINDDQFKKNTATIPRPTGT